VDLQVLFAQQRLGLGKRLAQLHLDYRTGITCARPRWVGAGRP
jgi:hypothetical protein